jgi:hypothetical protein
LFGDRRVTIPVTLAVMTWSTVAGVAVRPYFTARCPVGCECWLHRYAVAGHLTRCGGFPWVDDGIGDEAMVSDEEARAVMTVLPEELWDVPDHAGVVHGWFHGEVVTSFLSPFPGIAPRRWSQVAAAALAAGIVEPAGLLDVDTFRRVERTLALTRNLAVCDRCGMTVRRGGLSVHKASNQRCRWIYAAEEVRRLWADGWRDPYTVPGTPLIWGDLQKARWRSRVRAVRFPLWMAVLISP